MKKKDKIKTVKKILKQTDWSKLFVEQNSKQTAVYGGLWRKRSRCCGASIVMSGTGIRRNVCLKCGKIVHERRLC